MSTPRHIPWWQRFLSRLAGNPVDEPERSGFGSNIIKDGRCPDCGSEKWREGPHGGMSINIKCANQACGSKFNVGPGGYCERI